MKTSLTKSRIVAIMQIVFAAGIIGYWAVCFLLSCAGRAGSFVSAEHAAFEAAFPLADGLLAAALFVAGICLWRGSRLGAQLSGATGGALIFLGILDVTFNLQNGVYAHGTFLGLMNVTINALCIGFGLWLVYSMRRLVLLPRSRARYKLRLWRADSRESAFVK